MRKMTQGSIARHLIAYALPLILGNLFQLTYNAVDSIVIGKFAGENALAAVSAANPVMTIMILGVSGVSIGASVLMSRFYGAGDEDALRLSIRQTMTIARGCAIEFKPRCTPDMQGDFIRAQAYVDIIRACCEG